MLRLATRLFWRETEEISRRWGTRRGWWGWSAGPFRRTVGTVQYLTRVGLHEEGIVPIDGWDCTVGAVSKF
jgi:hypothetical protein